MSVRVRLTDPFLHPSAEMSLGAAGTSARATRQTYTALGQRLWRALSACRAHNRVGTWAPALLLLAVGFSASGQTSFDEDRRGAEAGEPRAMTALAHRYEHGQGCPRDAGQAILWYLRAAARNET